MDTEKDWVQHFREIIEGENATIRQEAERESSKEKEDAKKLNTAMDAARRVCQEVAVPMLNDLARAFDKSRRVADLECTQDSAGASVHFQVFAATVKIAPTGEQLAVSTRVIHTPLAARESTVYRGKEETFSLPIDVGKVKEHLAFQLGEAAKACCRKRPSRQ